MSEGARDLTAAIRAKLASGELPSATPEKVWAGKGTGLPRRACGLPITVNNIEFEVDLPGVRAAMRLHQGCLTVWDQYRKDFPPEDVAAFRRRKFI